MAAGVELKNDTTRRVMPSSPSWFCWCGQQLKIYKIKINRRTLYAHPVVVVVAVVVVGG
jgi:hypothetical protein